MSDEHSRVSGMDDLGPDTNMNTDKDRRDRDGDDDDDDEVMDLLANCSFKSLSIPCQTDYIGVDIHEKIMADIRVDNHHPLFGMILVTLSALLYAALNLSVSSYLFLTATPWQELMFIRMVITWMVTMLWLCWIYPCKLNLRGPSKYRRLMLLRAVFCWGAIVQCWWSFEFLPVGLLLFLFSCIFYIFFSVFSCIFFCKNSNPNQKRTE